MRLTPVNWIEIVCTGNRFILLQLKAEGTVVLMVRTTNLCFWQEATSFTIYEFSFVFGTCAKWCILGLGSVYYLLTDPQSGWAKLLNHPSYLCFSVRLYRRSATIVFELKKWKEEGELKLLNCWLKRCLVWVDTDTHWRYYSMLSGCLTLCLRTHFSLHPQRRSY